MTYLLFYTFLYLGLARPNEDFVTYITKKAVDLTRHPHYPVPNKKLPFKCNFFNTKCNCMFKLVTYRNIFLYNINYTLYWNTAIWFLSGLT